MTRFKLWLLIIPSLVLTISSCNDDDTNNDNPPDNGNNPSAKQLTVKFDNVIGSDDLATETGWYPTAKGDTFSITKLNYYISNIKLTAEDGSVYADSGYYIIREQDPDNMMAVLDDLPAKTYTSLEFLVGVDSSHNYTGDQSGALDVGYGMFWDWNTGYIFFKIEGYYSSAIDSVSDEAYLFHIGENENLRTITLPINADLSTANTADFTVEADILQLFNGGNGIRIEPYAGTMLGPDARVIADQYQRLFSIRTQ